MHNFTSYTRVFWLFFIDFIMKINLRMSIILIFDKIITLLKMFKLHVTTKEKYSLGPKIFVQFEFPILVSKIFCPVWISNFSSDCTKIENSNWTKNFGTGGVYYYIDFFIFRSILQRQNNQKKFKNWHVIFSFVDLLTLKILFQTYNPNTLFKFIFI